jgi:hypothetical protein
VNPYGGNIFLNSTASRPAVAHPVSYPMGTGGGGISPGGKRLKREADNSPPPSSEVKNDGAIYISTSE